MTPHIGNHIAFHCTADEFRQKVSPFARMDDGEEGRIVIDVDAILGEGAPVHQLVGDFFLDASGATQSISFISEEPPIGLMIALSDHLQMRILHKFAGSVAGQDAGSAKYDAGAAYVRFCRPDSRQAFEIAKDIWHV